MIMAVASKQRAGIRRLLFADNRHARAGHRHSSTRSASGAPRWRTRLGTLARPGSAVPLCGRVRAGMSVRGPNVGVMTDRVTAAAPGIRSAPLSELAFTVVDIETTGWAPEDAGITEIGAVRVQGGTVVAEFGSLVNPGIPVPEAITALTGISDQMLVSAPLVGDVLPSLLAFAEGSVLTAHNAPFDLRFLTAACAAMGRDWPGFEVLDTVRLARHLMATPQEVPDRKLATLARFFGTPVRPSHRALDDA